MNKSQYWILKKDISPDRTTSACVIFNANRRKIFSCEYSSEMEYELKKIVEEHNLSFLED